MERFTHIYRVFFALLLAAGCHHSDEVPADTPLFDVQLNNVSIRTFKKATQTLEAKTPVLTLSRSDKSYTAQQLKAHFFKTDDVLDATTFRGALDSNDFLANENIFRRADGATLTSSIAQGMENGTVLHFVNATTQEQPARKPALEVTAKTLALNTTKHEALYKGNAIAKRGDRILECDEMLVRYDDQNQVDTILATGHVFAHENLREARGDVGDFDNKTGVLTLKGSPATALDAERRVFGTKIIWRENSQTSEVENATSIADKTKTQDRITVSSDRLYFDKDKRSARWVGHARATKLTTLVLAREMLAIYTPAGEIDKLTATGGVEVFDQDRWAKSRQAVYDETTTRLVMTGAPEAKQNGQHLRGSRIYFHTKNKVVDVENAVTVLLPKESPSTKTVRDAGTP